MKRRIQVSIQFLTAALLSASLGWLAGSLLSGCNKAPTVAPGTISISDTTVKSTLFDLGVSEATAAVCLSNPSYTIPEREWVTGPFATAFRDWAASQGLRYQKDEEDCKTFTRAAAFYAEVLHAKDPAAQPGTAIAVGEFWYISPQGGHAVNVVLIQDASPQKYRLMFFEPQTQLEVKLTQQEIESCIMCRI
jgi:hypothetical protein